MSAPNNFGSNLTKSIIVLQIDPNGVPYGPDNPMPIDLIIDDTAGIATAANQALQLAQSTGTFTTATTQTVTSGGVSQQVFGANASRVYLLIVNPSDTIMYVEFGSAATTASIPIAANGGFYEPLVAPGQTVNLLCATTGKAFVAKQA